MGTGTPTGEASANEARELARAQAKAARTGKTVRGVVLALAGGSLWGFSGTCAKFLMETYAVDPVWLVCVRQLIASAMFLILTAALPHDRERLREFGRTRGGGARGVLMLVLTAACMLVNSTSYVIAINRTNSATATVLQVTGLIVLMAYACVRARRRPRRRELAGVALALAGTFLLATGGDPTRLAMPADGLAWGVVCGVSYALYTAVPESSLKRWGSPLVNGVAMLISGLTLLVFVRPWGHVPALDAHGLVWLAIIIFVGTFLAFALYLQGVKDVGPLRASMLGTSEPISATVFSVLWLGTVFTPADIAGFVLIIVMVYLTA